MNNSTKPLLVAASIVALGVAWLIIRQRLPSPGAGSGRVAFPVTSRDVGRILVGDKVDLRFPVRNKGKGELHLTVETDCGCLISDYPRSLAPAQEAEIRARLSTEAPGRITKFLSVMTDDPGHPREKLAVRADVLPIFTADPQPLVLPFVPDKIYRSEIRLIPRKGVSISPDLPAGGSLVQKATFVPPASNDPRKAWRLRLVLGPFPSAGTYTIPITFSTGNSRMPSGSVMVVGTSVAAASR